MGDEPIHLRPNAQPGQIWTFDRIDDLEMFNRTWAYAHVQARRDEMHERRTGVIEVLHASGGLATSVRVTFNDECENTRTMLDRAQRIPFAFAGKTVVVTRGVDGCIIVEHDGTAPAEETEDLHRLLEPDTSIYPPHLVAVGDDWVGVADDRMITGRCFTGGMIIKLVEVAGFRGRRVAQVLISGQRPRLTPEFRIKSESSGSATVDIETGRILRFDVTTTSTQQLQAGEFLPAIGSSGSSRSRAILKSDLVER